MPTVALSVGLVEPLGEFGTLVNSVRSWLNRDDLTDLQITEFIAMFEARMNRVLRHPEMEEVVSATLTTGNNDLPSDFLSMRAIYRDTQELKAMTPAAIVREYGTGSGYAVAYSIIGSQPRKIRLGPQPASDTPVTMIYYKKLTGVDENNADNWLLNEHPDLYLFGTLVMAEAYLANDERIPMWKAAFDESLRELDRSAQNDRFGGAPLVAGSVAQIRGVRA